ncbi:beta-defensin 114 [Saimiri boliviensis]|uniref:Beta-defensin n=1 Tax=Saimiri boliviensis boliviensis TaxID=39432 RepID=A0A2K6V8B8_SAIBB|nr:beta-defensin 114 [Saimiri boliviensis boliviensis]
MRIFYYLLHFLCCVTFILPATRTLVDADRCTKRYGRCKRDCLESEKQIDICSSPRKICCTDRLYEEDYVF